MVVSIEIRTESHCKPLFALCVSFAVTLEGEKACGTIHVSNQKLVVSNREWAEVLLNRG